MSTPVDNYCERLGPGLWAEPLNAATNLVFLLAAWLIWRFARQRGALTGRIRLVVALMVAVGIGSGLFHTVATTLTEWLDIIPILLFQLVFLWLYFRDLMGLGRVSATLFLAAFLAAALAGESYAHVMNGSLLYLPTLIILVFLGAYHYHKPLAERGILLSAAGVFLVSLAFRTVDDGICERLPIGTHFMWHILNGLLLYLVARALVVNAGQANGP